MLMPVEVSIEESPDVFEEFTEAASASIHIIASPITTFMTFRQLGT